ALVDPPPQVLVGPVRERVVLPQTPLLVAFDQLRLGARRALLAAQARDPALGAPERALEGRDLGDRAAVLGAAPRNVGTGRVEDLDLHAEALLEGPPGLQRLLEQHAGVDRHDPNRGAGALIQAHELVDQDGLLLLEGAQQDGVAAVPRGLAQRVREAQRGVDAGLALGLGAVQWLHLIRPRFLVSWPSHRVGSRRRTRPRRESLQTEHPGSSR